MSLTIQEEEMLDCIMQMSLDSTDEKLLKSVSDYLEGQKPKDEEISDRIDGLKDIIAAISVAKSQNSSEFSEIFIERHEDWLREWFYESECADCPGRMML